MTCPEKWNVYSSHQFYTQGGPTKTDLTAYCDVWQQAEFGTQIYVTPEENTELCYAALPA